MTSVSISQPAAEMIIGETVQLSATVLPSDATDKSITWASSKQSVATVSGSGKVTAVAEGVSTITATAGGKYASCTVTVSKGYVAVTSVTLNKTELTLEKGKTETLTATVNPSDATDQTVTWSSSKTDVATVDANGKVTATAGGSAIISAKAGDKQATCTVTVSVPVESIALDRESLTLEEEATTTLVATVKPDDATDKTVAWFSSNNEIATVDETGKVTAIKAGEATITAKAGEKTAACKVTVNKKFIAVTSVTLNKAELALEKGQSETLVATVKPDDATDKTVTWKSSDDNVATVDNAGKVTALAGGSAVITAKAGEKESTCAVAVTVPVTSVSLDQNSLTLEEDQTATLTATVMPEDATDKTVTWSSSNDAVAKVESGVITAIKEGTATITARTGDKEAKCTVTVKINPLKLPITFTDTKIKAKLVSAFDTNHDGEISYIEAQSVSSLENVFGTETDFTSFNEFQYFTGISFVSNSLFKDWEHLTSIVLPESLTSIEASAFENAYLLSSINLPNSITAIHDSAFKNCYSLAMVSLPSSLVSIGSNAFYGCTNMMGQLLIPDKLQTIGSYAFASCSGLSGDLTFPDSVSYISAYAFGGCSNLDGRLSFSSKTYLRLGERAFNGCKSFHGDLVLTNNISFYGGYTFEGAGFTGSVYTYISGWYSFYSCTIGGNLIIEDNVTDLQNAFRFVSVAGYVYIGKNAAHLSDQCFSPANCSTYYIAAVTPPVCEGDAIRLSGCYLGVSKGRKQAYLSAEPWNKAKTIEEVDFSSLKIIP